MRKFMAENKGDVSRIILVDQDEEYNIKDEDVLKIIKDKQSYPKVIKDGTSGAKKTFDTLEKELEFVRKKVISDSELTINYSDSIQEETEDSLYSRKINGIKQPQLVGFWNSLDGNTFSSGIQSIINIGNGIYRVTLDKGFNIFNRKFDGSGNDSFKINNNYITRINSNSNTDDRSFNVKIIQTFFDKILSNTIFEDKRSLNKDIYNSENLIQYLKESVNGELNSSDSKYGDVVVQVNKGYFTIYMLDKILKSIGLSDCISFNPVPSTSDFDVNNLLYYINSNKFFITCNTVDGGGRANIPTLVGIKTSSNSILKYSGNSYENNGGTYHCTVYGNDNCTVNVSVSELYIRVTDNNEDNFQDDAIFKNLTVWYCDSATKR